METINAATSSGLTARLFQNLRVGGETLADPQRAARERAPQFGETVQRNHRADLKRNLEPGSLPARPEKAQDRDQEQPASSAASFSYQRSERTSLFLTTQQGDTVEIKIRNQNAADATLNEFESGDTLLSQFSLLSKDSSKISLVINGDLNTDELRAIGSVVDQVSGIAQKFFSGNVADAFATAERFNMDGAQLADVAIGMRFEERLTYTQMNGLPPLAQPISNPLEDLQAGTAVQLPAANEPSPAPPANPLQPFLPAPANTSAPLPTAPPGALNSHAQVMHEALNAIGEFLKGLLHNLQQPAAGEKAGETAPMGVALKIKIFKSVLTAAHTSDAPAKHAPAPLPALVGDTLDALSAKHEPPLSTVV